MSKITKIFSFISIMFIAILLLVSCGGESDNKTGESTKTVDNSVFTDNYDIKITYTIKPTTETYTYKYVHDCRIQIKAKATAKDTCKIKLSIYDGEADAFSEEIITRYYSLNTKSNIDEKIEDVYTNELLLAWSNKMSIVDSTDTNYTKNFLNEKTISFESNGGSRCESISVNIVNSKLPTPTKTGYSFDGWYNSQNFQKKISDFNDINDGMKLYAKWSLINYTINYNITTDVINENINKYNIETETFILNEPTRKGYTFKGWYDKKDFSGNVITKISKGSWGSFTLYPKWEANTYDVELRFNDGVTENTVVKQTYDSNYNLPTPTRDGYVFEGWYLDENDYSSLVSKVSVANNHILFAKWVEGTSGLTYSKTSKGWEITGCTNKDATSILIPSSIAGVDVVSIKSQAFSGMNKITEIVIPDTVTLIGQNAFYNCGAVTKLTTPYLPASTFGNELGYIFGSNGTTTQTYISQRSCSVPSSLTEVTITKATKIGAYAFYKLSNLSKITIPNTITSISDYAFYNCTGITKVDIPETVNSIGSYAFYNCSNLLSIAIPSSVTKINDYSFYNLNKITELIIPDAVTSIGQNAFEGCTGISTITIPSNCTTIGIYAFSGMNKITEIVIPDTVTSIGQNAFYNCGAVTKLTTPYLPASTFGNELGYIFGSNGTTTQTYISQRSCSVPSSLTEVTITKATKIGAYAFYKLSNLSKITIPNTITSISDYAFYNCTGITKVYFNGTLNEWNQIIANSGENTPLAYGAKLYVKNNGGYVEVTND